MFQNLFVFFNDVCPSFHYIHYFLQLFVCSFVFTVDYIDFINLWCFVYLSLAHIKVEHAFFIHSWLVHHAHSSSPKHYQHFDNLYLLSPMNLQQIGVYVFTFQDILPIFIPIHKLISLKMC
jgi:hypothetical protein